jgi:hypothetical protein
MQQRMKDAANECSTCAGAAGALEVVEHFQQRSVRHDRDRHLRSQVANAASAVYRMNNRCSKATMQRNRQQASGNKARHM